MIVYFIIFLILIAIISILVISRKNEEKKEPYLADWNKYQQCRCNCMYKML